MTVYQASAAHTTAFGLHSFHAYRTNMPPTHLVDEDYLKYAMESYVADINEDANKTTIIFTLTEKPGALAETLRVFQVGSHALPVYFLDIFDIFA
ncbi:hypothetical protein GCK32_021869 [Trichostrongylus colubriformis]|uniref:Uncharacterized protein n=1 Tax=Trichostrongylus colubriformis TaxID=6319 RepID=A0AAN8FWN7_TRICO